MQRLVKREALFDTVNITVEVYGRANQNVCGMNVLDVRSGNSRCGVGFSLPVDQAKVLYDLLGQVLAHYDVISGNS